MDLAKHLQCDPCRIVFVGDRLYTDIVYGNLVGMRTILVKDIFTEQGDNPMAIWVI
jgi:phosphatidylglycerophosphatase GEP4